MDCGFRFNPRVGGALRRAAILGVALLLAAPMPARPQQVETEYTGAAALGLGLRSLGTSKRVLMIAAHPDDETTQLLSTLALGEGAAVAYLSLTRGEGGQNGIGPELQEALGLLRSEELLAARRLDGAGQYFTRAYDWGFSRSAEEAFGHWPPDSLLADVVAVVRHFRPDVIVSVFSGTTRDGHGQHQAAGSMARQAFEAAGDAGRFPAQLDAGLRPHAPARLYQLVRGGEEGPGMLVRTGDLDPLLGLSHFQVAMASRSRHRSQDMGRLQTPGPQATGLHLVAERVAGGETGLFAGLDTTLAARFRRAAYAASSPASEVPAALLAYEAGVEAAREAFNPLRSASALGPLLGAARDLDAARHAFREEGQGDAELAFHLAAEGAELGGAVAAAAGIRVDAVSERETLVAGERAALELTVWNGGDEVVALRRVEPLLPAGWTARALDPLPPTLAGGALLTRRFEVSVPADAVPTEPYYLRQGREGAFYRWPAAVGPVGIPFEADPLRMVAELEIDGVAIELERDASYRGLDRRSGEYRRPVRVVPAVSLSLEPGLAVVPVARVGQPLRFDVRLLAEDPAGAEGTLVIEAPDGWTAEPDRVPLRLSDAGATHAVEVELHAPPGVAAGSAPLGVHFEDARGRRFDRGYALVDYPHIRPRPLYRPARSLVRLLDVEVPAGLRVGYVAGPGDDGPRALAQLGVHVELLGPGALAAQPLDAYHAIVVGIRAYEVRPDLVASNPRLLDYVRRGGTMIVQYNQYAYTEPGIAPYPVTMSRPHDRVTDQNAPVRLLAPDHPVLSRPNRIGPADFEGWVQERGLYFLHTWDDRYQPLLEMADPGFEPLRGSLLVTSYGEGHYVYTGLALFRQLPAGVPGAYRLFANLLALGVRE